MQKIMFNDKFCLTQAVLDGRKTMTRRFAEKVLVEDENGELHWNGEFKPSRYKVGEVVAIARSYAETLKDQNPRINRRRKELLRRSPGWTNKMFVLAELMTYRIRITNVRVERLQDISDADCLREGIEEDSPYYWVPVNTSLPNWRKTAEGVSDMYPNDRDGKVYPHFWDSPRKAFAALIDKVSGKGTFGNNPWVFVYEFELVQ